MKASSTLAPPMLPAAAAWVWEWRWDGGGQSGEMGHMPSRAALVYSVVTVISAH